jgi:quinol monooxygenase YgiN
MSVVVVATVYPVAEHRDEVLAAFAHAVERVHVEDEGCELYALHEGRDRFVMIEKWTNGEALRAHGEGPTLEALHSAIAGKIVGDIEVQVLRPHPAGTDEQGRL